MKPTPQRTVQGKLIFKLTYDLKGVSLFNCFTRDYIHPHFLLLWFFVLSPSGNHVVSSSSVMIGKTQDMLLWWVAESGRKWSSGELEIQFRIMSQCFPFNVAGWPRSVAVNGKTIHIIVVYNGSQEQFSRRIHRFIAIVSRTPHSECWSTNCVMSRFH